MKRINHAIFTLLFLMVVSSCWAIDFEYIRSNYEKAVDNKKVCETILEQLLKNTETNVHTAYLGAFLTIWANHTVSPISKLNSFNKGKEKIEQGILAEPNNIEIRFIRYSVQKSSPSFLGYNNNLQEDEQFIKNNLNTIRSQNLREMCNNLIK